MDLAQLTLGVDSSPLKEGQSWLQKFSATALGTAKDTDKLNDALVQGSTATGKMTSSIDRLLGPLANFKGLIGGLFAGFSLSVLGNMADTWSDVSSRVGVAIGNMDQADAVMQRLTTTARLTYSSLSQTAEGFVRNSTVLQALGKSTEDQIKYTEALNLALVASGTKGQQALSVQEALSKGMTNGKLATEQLQTVLNNSSEVSKALADELGTTVLGLADLAKQGKITGDVIFNALTKRLEEFTTKAEEMPATLGDGFLLIGNALTALVGSFDRVSGVTSYLAGLMVSLSDGILWVANNIDKFTVSADTLEKILWTIAPAMIAAFGPAVLGMVGSLIGAVGTGLVTAFVTLRTVMLAHPLVFFGTVIATLISYFHNWVEAFPLVTKAFDWLYDKAMFVLNTIKTAFEALLGADFFKGGEVNVNLKGEDAANKIRNGMKAGGDTASDRIRAGIESGAKSGAQLFESGAQAAVAKFESMNGKLSEVIVKSHKTGAEYLYNAYTGAVKQATASATQSMKQGVESGGETAGKSMEAALVKGGQEAGAVIYNTVESAFASLAHISLVIEQYLKQARAERNQMAAESAKALAEADRARAEAEAIRRGGSKGGGYGGSGGGGSYGGGRGNSNNAVGGPVGWNDPFFSPGQQAAEGGTGTTTVTQIKNVVDPNMMIDTLDTAQGHNAIINVIKYNREELRALLGST